MLLRKEIDESLFMRSEGKLSEKEPVTIGVAERLFIIAGAVVFAA